ncbi:MAG: DNA-binding protein [Salinisphaera sp.]|jgi:predicted DNA-binding transcriptional regulator AlpA|nr:DNA-binding protein [Salinisphaera sp.]
MEYMFTLKYRLSGHYDDSDALIERLGAAGCDDALPGIGLTGRLALEFTREADSAADALHSALADVKRALPMAELVEVLPDYVGLTDVAEFMSMSRQNLRKLMTANPGSFPSPVHDGNPSLWHLVDVLGWLESKGYAVDPLAFEISRLAREVNLAKESRRAAVSQAAEWHALVV